MVKSIYISVGSNLGNKLVNCLKGIEYIGNSKFITVVAYSNFYLTSPTDYENQGWFVNSIIKIKTDLSPGQLLNKLLIIQNKVGNLFFSKKLRFGPRLLDLDIILYKNKILNSSKLQIPHPRMHKRLFVLKPFCDIAPDIIHPLFNVSINFLLQKILKNQQKIFQISFI